jgi:glutamine amidotransferase
MSIAIFDYGAGNLHSLAKALDTPATPVSVETDLRVAIRKDVLVLPGVGGFAPAASALSPARAELADALADGLQCVGICLGMQLLFDSSDEGAGDGIGWFAGRVTRLHAKHVPHMGWSPLEPAAGVDVPHLPSHAYFAHSYAVRDMDPAIVTAWATLDDDRFPSVVQQGRVTGVQFHPEKSSRDGVAFLRSLVGAPE